MYIDNQFRNLLLAQLVPVRCVLDVRGDVFWGEICLGVSKKYPLMRFNALVCIGKKLFFKFWHNQLLRLLQKNKQICNSNTQDNKLYEIRQLYGAVDCCSINY